MKSLLTYLLLGTLLFSPAHAQKPSFNEFLKPSDTLNVKREKGVMIAQGAMMTVGLVGLNSLWYSDFERSSFKSLNDADEWFGLDKYGHVLSAYHLNRLVSDSYRWSGTESSKYLLYGSAISLGFLTAIEVMDGFSEEWGFSWPDMASNFLGSGIYVGQELLWKEQRILLKYSFHQTQFANMNPDKLGDGFVEELFKDYNGQTFWVSANLNAFLPEANFPSWLNLAVGYGAEGMLTGRPVYGNDVFSNQNRYAQWYLSLDVDLSRIRTNSHVLKSVFSVINILKIPMPTLMYNIDEKFKFYLLYF